MSKNDDLRALREARYAANSARLSSRPARPVASATPIPSPAAVAAPVEPVAEALEPVGSASDELCGHRNMSGRSCTRESGHAAKSHRYS